MKILQINATYGIGSTGRYTKLLHENIKKHGHQSYVVTTITDDSASGDPDIFIPCGRISQKFNGLRARITGNQNNIAVRSTAEIIKFIKRVNPDIIQLGNIHANFVNLKALLEYAAKKDIAIVVVLHDCWFFTGKCTYFTDAGCMKWKTGCSSCPKIKKDIPSWFFDKTEKMLREKKDLFDRIKKLTVVGVSEGITEDAKKSYVFSGRNCTCIPNAIDDTIFYAEKSDSSADAKKNKTVVGVSAVWSEYKGINDFLKLGQLCKAQLGDLVQIKLVGRFDNLDQSLKEKLDLSGVQMLGSLDADSLAELYRSADVFISMSKGESFGCSISEAIMCGLPVISYRGYAEGDIVSRYRRGYVVEDTGNIKKVFEILKKILEDEKFSDTESCVADDYKPLNVDEYVEKFLKMYEEF